MEALNVGKVLRRSHNYDHCARLFHFATDYCIRAGRSKLTGAYSRTPCSDLAACERANHSLRHIPRNYSPPARVPLILALHFGVDDGNSAGAGREVVGILIGPALADLGAIIVAPDSLRGDWSSPENEDAVIALL